MITGAKTPQAHPRRKSDAEDPFLNPSAGSPTLLAAAVRDARASLRNPTRPFTPAKPSRHLFDDPSVSRPNSSQEPAANAKAFDVPATGGASAPETPAATPRASESSLSASRSSGSLKPRRASAGSDSAIAGAASSTARAAGRTSAPMRSPGSKPLADPVAGGPRAPPTRQKKEPASPSEKEKEPAPSLASASSPPSKAPVQQSPEWIAIREIVPVLETGLAAEGGTEALAKALGRTVELVEAGALRSTAPSAAATGANSPKRVQYVLHALGVLMASPAVLKVPDVLARLCKLYLILAQGGAMLTAAAKTLYAMSKDKANDTRFRTERLVDSALDVIGRAAASPGAPGGVELQALLFLCGALKHTSENEAVRLSLAALNALTPLTSLICPETLSALVEAAISARPETPAAGKEPRERAKIKVGQMLVQITATMRNLAVGGAAREAKHSFVESGAISALCGLLRTYGDQSELVLNVCRILSKVTLFPECLAAVSKEDGAVEALLKILWRFPTNAPLVVRACFVLGNLTGEDEHHRVEIARTHAAVEPLVGLLKQYVKLDAETAALNEPQEDKSTQTMDAPPVAPALPEKPKATASLTEIEQVLIKLIRLLANLAISREIGPAVAATPGVEILCDLLDKKSPTTHEELVLNIVGAITNFSFYATKENLILQRQLDVSRMLFPLLHNDNDEFVIESVRAFGNFSRSEVVRTLMCEKRIDEVMSILLEHRCKEVAFNACGVIMNLATDRARLNASVLSETVPRLLQLLSAHSVESEAETLTVACKAMFNLCIEPSGATSTSVIGITQLAELKRALERITKECSEDDTKAELLHVSTQLARLATTIQVKQ